MAFLDSDFGIDFEEIEGWAKKAHEILDAKGVDKYTGDRIFLNRDRGVLTIGFDARENTGLNYWSTVLSIGSKGHIQSVARHHLSEVEAGEGDDEYAYLPWETWLNRLHKKKDEAESTLPHPGQVSLI